MHTHPKTFLGNPLVLPLESCHCTFWTSSDFARSHLDMPQKANCHCFPKVPEEHTYMHRSFDQLRQPDKRRLAVPIILPFRLHLCHGIRIGEAKHPGPTLPAQCTCNQKPLGNPLVLPLESCHCTFWTSSDVARSHIDTLIAAKRHCFPKVPKEHKYRHRSPDQSRQPDKRSLVGLNFPPFRLHPCRGMRIGEAKYPGPSSPAQCKSTQKPLGNPNVLPSGSCNCTFRTSPDFARSHFDMLLADKCHCLPKVLEGHKYSHRSSDQFRQPDKRRLVSSTILPFRLHPCPGIRIGEAKHPGPTLPAQCTCTQKPLGNPLVLPLESCHCTFWTSSDFARSHLDMPQKATCHCLPKVPEELKYMHRSFDHLRQPDKRRLAVPIILPFRLHPCHGIRIGEAKHPGPTLPAQCTCTQKPLGNPLVLPLESCHCTFWTSSVFARSHSDMPQKANCHCLPKVPEEHKYMHRSFDQLRQPDKRRLAVPIILPFRLHPCHGIRIGEAKHPGPTLPAQCTCTQKPLGNPLVLPLESCHCTFWTSLTLPGRILTCLKKLIVIAYLRYQRNISTCIDPLIS